MTSSFSCFLNLFPSPRSSHSTISKNMEVVQLSPRLSGVELGTREAHAVEHVIQFFILVQVPMNGMMPGSQFVPQQLTLLPNSVGNRAESCPECNNPIQAGWKYCPQCGVQISCPSCSSIVATSNKYCPNCGKAL